MPNGNEIPENHGGIAGGTQEMAQPDSGQVPTPTNTQAPSGEDHSTDYMESPETIAGNTRKPY